MAYRLSATKLNSYRSCPQAYYFRYERKLEGQSSFGSPILGNALHKALATFYQDWNYGTPIPPRSWLNVCWEACSRDLSPSNQAEGFRRMVLYYERFVLAAQQMSKPLGIEQWIKANASFNNVDFLLTGKYDRLDYYQDGLALIDYKSGEPPNYSNEPDLQLGFYDQILETRYQKALKVWKLIYLKTGEEVAYTVTDKHRAQVRTTISDLSQSLKNDQTWTPCPGEQCDRCSYQKYCLAMTEKPEPLPEEAQSLPNLQYSLDVSMTTEDSKQVENADALNKGKEEQQSPQRIQLTLWL